MSILSIRKKNSKYHTRCAKTAVPLVSFSSESQQVGSTEKMECLKGHVGSLGGLGRVSLVGWFLVRARLGGGFKYFLFATLLGEMIPFD